MLASDWANWFFEILWRHAVRATGNVAPRGDAGLNKVLFDVLAHVAWRRSVKRQVTAFRANHELSPRKTTFLQHLEGRANRSLTSLKAIIGGGIDHVRAQLDGARHRFGVALIEFFGRLAEVSADAELTRTSVPARGENGLPRPVENDQHTSQCRPALHSRSRASLPAPKLLYLK
jgi:hypothetical protein